ncbi:Alkane 1-monooxygenase [Pseudovibrio axinellae]|uniref:Alkane 1-monooxygenase n=1 Tax=Pseudovibrio axinellae TaxID=989403 RepID=A0A166B1A5_9HYPH|nr:alkane 1-monooxygenase [Pseudovibrio axinellae]KZL21809.1 Alkane 1-monooxygenase [Pseudovibrio axinellae]SEQ79358.1 alkane 1-monooxygenase [Pseudovibrio axinellae]
MVFKTHDNTGKSEVYQDAKRYYWLIAYASSSITLVSIALYVYTLAYAVLFIPIIYFFVVIPALDALLGEDPYNPPDDVLVQMAEDPYYSRLVRWLIPYAWVILFTSVWLIGTYELPLWLIVVFAFGKGLFAGGTINMAHELGHKTNKTDQWLAKLALATVGYGHFCIEHNRGHHIHVATPEDPASSRMGESIYAFALREIPGAFARGWENEKQRLQKKGLSTFSLKNDILQGYALTLIVFSICTAIFGWQVLLFLVIQSVVGWYGLTQANYVEHYGLLRQKNENGKYERCQPRHSWNTNHIFSNLSTFHLQRHSDHHANPLRPYQTLRNFSDLPRLPSGYPGCFALAAIPSLWFKTMDPKVMEWAGGDINKVNRGSMSC